LQGFKVREAAIDRIKHLAELDSRQPDGGGTSYTIFGPSGFFKDYDRIFRSGLADAVWLVSAVAPES